MKAHLLLPSACLFALLAPPQAAHAQAWHAVGSGTGANTATGLPSPFSDMRAGQRAQYIYLAPELSAAGLNAGDAIVRLRWVVTALNGSGMQENYTVRVGATSATTLTGFRPMPNSTSSTPVDFQPVVGNNDFTLEDPFVWDGTSNLLVEASHFSPTYGTASANASVAFTSTAPAKRSYTLLDDLMFTADQTIAFNGETVNSQGLPNIVLGVAEACAPLAAQDLVLCANSAVPAGEGLHVAGCTESLGGRFSVSVNFPGADLPCSGTDWTPRAAATLPELPAGAVVQGGRLILTNVQAPDPTWMSDLLLQLTGSIQGDIQLMPAFEQYSGTVPRLMMILNGPYTPGTVQLSTASTNGTGVIGGARLEFDYLLPTPFWYDAPQGGNLVAYGQNIVDPVAAGLATTDTAGTLTLYAHCGTASSACISDRTPVAFTVLAWPAPSFELDQSLVVAGEPASFTYTGSSTDSYLWDFGDGETSSEEHPQHTWDLPGTYTVEVTADNGTCTETFSLAVAVDVNTGVADHGRTELWVRTDAGRIVIGHGFGAAPVDVAVYDAVGRCVMARTGIVQPGRVELPAGSLNAGVWFVRVKSGNSERTIRMPVVR